jgi:hypothetical protein
MSEDRFTGSPDLYLGVSADRGRDRAAARNTAAGARAATTEKPIGGAFLLGPGIPEEKDAVEAGAARFA